MFPGRSSDLQVDLLAGLPRHDTQCRDRLSYLLTAAGQFRIFTGFPFHPLERGTEELDHYIQGNYEMQRQVL